MHPSRFSGTLLALAPTLLAFSAGQEARAQELVIWHGYRGEERAALEQVVADYTRRKAGGGPKARLLAIPSDAFLDKITAAVPRGQGPAVFIGPQDRLRRRAEAGNTGDPATFHVDDAARKPCVPSTPEAIPYKGAP